MRRSPTCARRGWRDTRRTACAVSTAFSRRTRFPLPPCPKKSVLVSFSFLDLGAKPILVLPHHTDTALGSSPRLGPSYGACGTTMSPAWMAGTLGRRYGTIAVFCLAIIKYKLRLPHKGDVVRASFFGHLQVVSAMCSGVREGMNLAFRRSGRLGEPYARRMVLGF